MKKVIIGIDIAKDSFDLAVIGRENAELLREMQLPNTQIGHQRLLVLAKTFEVERVVLEATGTYHLALTQCLFEAHLPVCLVNPLQHRRFSQMKLRRGKTDRIDARSLGHYGREQKPPLYRPQALEQQHLKQLSVERELLVKQRTMFYNFIHAYERVPDTHTRSMAIAEQAIAHIEELIKALEAEQVALIEAAYSEVRDLMLSIKGIGPQTVTMLLAYVGDLRHFKHAKQLSAYVGLNPKQWESGQWKGQVHISKQGHKRLRRLLFLCARAAVRSNPSCQAFFGQLVGRGKARKVAYVAVANKLLRQLVAVVQSGQPYDPYYEQKSA